MSILNDGMSFFNAYTLIEEISGTGCMFKCHTNCPYAWSWFLLQTTEVELKQYFLAYGAVKDCKIIADRAGVSKG